ncbi:glycosyltransferase family 4 protein [Chromatium okenii]|jgi:glycosyltransferase involved in cell wall biosynthesis|uniref:glycosyltransferase family 4 protein n=1 Tax=Chromatium okenii TaxID=61644 RepID=UPI0026E9C56C|nr:glycosyltransferase family 4 protein [Chromatium okenii]MBV5311029.1 glycosyltransferase family 4 protein [Chromatium okenii]
MKILYHHRTASRDGQAVHIDEMIDALRHLGHEVVVVAPNSTAAPSFGDSIGWVDWIRTRLPKTLYELLELGYSLLAYRQLAQAIRASKPDVIYERYNLFLLAGIWAQRRFHVPLLLEVNAPLAEERMNHGGLAQPALAQWAQRWVWRNADGVLPVTRVLAGYVERAGVVPERITVIHNGINLAQFADTPNPATIKATLQLDDRFILGFTGFIRDWHGLDRVVTWIAANHQTHPTLHLLIVGDGPARPALERQAQALGISDRVSFTGVVARTEIPALVNAFDIALQPAVVDYASPLKLFEYLALGCAIVAPRQPNLEEILRDGENALLFDAAQPAALEIALDRLITDAALRTRLAQGAQQTISAGGFTWLENARRVTALAASLQGSAR